jgi:hypothetical protein
MELVICQKSSSGCVNHSPLSVEKQMSDTLRDLNYLSCSRPGNHDAQNAVHNYIMFTELYICHFYVQSSMNFQRRFTRRRNRKNKKQK